ncbi:hypothetical protein BCR33DRAFT_710983 [Rhizoclosmatium globosum]|uniref:Uncharacterized protein n=1 Tax=Rhizoclosmatium globosum TaxID=329046 RepID=A0A1Y2D2R5_9FUNG|nr:hypothetical protein BCR33DRAFT_710983 [Rhizoclosmatium globosum]|eukprot:ORY53588.1 hypothetical protein BCR33DRAFT_710983 [Rhizoclosmatium globosum]
MRGLTLIAITLVAICASAIPLPPPLVKPVLVVPNTIDAKGFKRKLDLDVAPVGQEEAKKLWVGLEKDQKGVAKVPTVVPAAALGRQ